MADFLPFREFDTYESDIMTDLEGIEVYRLSEPAEVVLTFYRTDMCEEALLRCGSDVERTDARTLKRRVAKLDKYSYLKF